MKSECYRILCETRKTISKEHFPVYIFFNHYFKKKKKLDFLLPLTFAVLTFYTAL